MSALPNFDSREREPSAGSAAEQPAQGPMDCSEIWRLTRLFLGGELGAEQNARLREHLDRCGPCRDEYRGAVMTAASIGHTHRRVREQHERESRRTSFRSLARDVSAGRGNPRKNWRLILYPLMAIALLSQLTRIGQGGGEVLRAEALAGEIRIGRWSLAPGQGARALESGQRCTLGPSDRVLVSAEGLRLTLEAQARLLVVGQHPLRLRHEWGRLLAAGQLSLMTAQGVVELEHGEAELSIDAQGLSIRALEGRVRFVDARGPRLLEPGQSLQIED